MELGLYAIKKNGDEYKVVLKRNGRIYFYGTKDECQEWVERNDGDEHN